MIYIFIVLIVISVFFMWPKEGKYFYGYKKIWAWWIDLFGKIICLIGWLGVLFQSWNLKSNGVNNNAISFAMFLAVCFMILFPLICYVVSDIRPGYPVMKVIEKEKLGRRDKEKIPYRIVKNIYLLHPESFSWEERFYPIYQHMTFRMSSIDLLRFSFLYSKKPGNKEVSNAMLKELEKDMAKIQENKEKSISMVNKAFNDLIDITAEKRDNKWLL